MRPMTIPKATLPKAPPAMKQPKAPAPAKLSPGAALKIRAITKRIFGSTK